MTAQRVVIVHERFTEFGGSERVVGELAKIWPGSRVAAPIADPRVVDATGLDGRVSTGPLQNLYGGGPQYAHLMPLLPWAMKHVDLTDADVVITSHHAFANRVRPPANVPVISYTHSPPRWIWDSTTRNGEARGRVGGGALSAYALSQRRADKHAAQHVAGVLANSSVVAERITRWWNRSSTVVPPPVDTEFFHPDARTPREDFLLLAGRLVPYKRPDIAVAAAKAAGVRLVVAGDGRYRARCEELAGDQTEFLGYVSTNELRSLYRRCRALVFPGLEDFGIVPVEAQACGAPVLALGAGGVLDSVLDGVTGKLVTPSSDRDFVVDLARTMRETDFGALEAQAIRSSAERFSVENFRRNVRAAVDEILENTPAPSLAPARGLQR